METLKVKLFEILTGKIAVEEFENWLYNLEEILRDINENPIYFDVISVNYKSAEWRDKLGSLIDADLFILSKTQNICKKINASESLDACIEFVSELVKLLRDDSFEETDYSVVYNFYSLYSRSDLIELGYMDSSEFMLEAKYYSKILLEKLKKPETLSEKIRVLKSPLEDNVFHHKMSKIDPKINSEKSKKLCRKSLKPTLKKKIVAFFKKS